jgi:hypothetical protein
LLKFGIYIMQGHLDATLNAMLYRRIEEARVDRPLIPRQAEQELFTHQVDEKRPYPANLCLFELARARRG